MRFVTTAFVLTLCALPARAAETPANYAGTWVLDKAQSHNLPPFYTRVASHKLVVGQDEQALKIEVGIEMARDTGTGVVIGASPLEAQASSRKLAASRKEAGKDRRLSLFYRLDGTPTVARSGVRTADGLVEYASTAVVTAGEQGRLHIETTGDVPLPGGPAKTRSVEDWSLSPGGEKLTVHRTDDAPLGRFSTELVFVRPKA